jgi:gamma-glutamyltranspeptidase
VPEEINVETKLAPEAKKSLERRGHSVKERTGLGVVQAILAKRSKIAGAVDSRKEERGRSD